MRCPSCGTDNAPDSRFCGGCGARFGPVERRVAPTAKMSDDASYPAPIASPVPGSLSAPLHGSLPGPAQMPPPRAASEPPAPSPASSYARTISRPGVSGRRAEPQVPDASASFAVPRRPVALIVLILLLDLALAGAGAWMLIQGLGG